MGCPQISLAGIMWGFEGGWVMVLTWWEKMESVVWKSNENCAQRLNPPQELASVLPLQTLNGEYGHLQNCSVLSILYETHCTFP